MKRALVFCLGILVFTVACSEDQHKPRGITAPALLMAGADVTDFKQCANKDPTLGDCNWINGIVQASNAKYFEGMSVPQRTVFTGIAPASGNVHTLTFSHDATKAGVHAYDWLTSYQQAIDAAVAAGTPFNDLNGQACGAAIGPPNTLSATCTSLRGGSNFFVVDVPDDPFTSKDGSTQSRINAYESVRGNRTIKIYGDALITAASLTLSHSVGDGGDTGDSEISYTLTWTSASTQILIEMAGHLAKSGTAADAWGAGLGSGQISGGPYHFNLHQLDGASLGSQDNQIKGADIFVAPGTITIIKDAVPDDAQDFSFTTTGTGLAGFSLDDDADPTLSNTKSFTGLAPGSYSVTEGDPTVVGFDLTKLACVETGTANSTTDVSTRTASITLDPGETVTCTYTDTKRVTVFGKTPGYWGNKNGVAQLDPNGNGTIGDDGIAGLPVTIGGTIGTETRVAIVADTATSNKILRKNACTAGSPVVFDCTLRSDALMVGTLNTLAAQTLALAYNVNATLGPGYSSNTISSLSCVPVLGLLPSNSVGEVLDKANSFIAGSVSGTTTSQSEAGQMNTLLGCLNREF